MTREETFSAAREAVTRKSVSPTSFDPAFGLDKSQWHVRRCGGETMLATFAFDVCHDVYRAAREVIDTKIPTLNLESSGKLTWRPDRLPRLGEYVCDFARAGERALGDTERNFYRRAAGTANTQTKVY